VQSISNSPVEETSVSDDNTQAAEIVSDVTATKEMFAFILDLYVVEILV